jgi:hypothetical protein
LLPKPPKISPVRNSDTESENYNSDYDVDLFDDSSQNSLAGSSEEMYGDLAQFMEFEGQVESHDPIWFQLMLNYLWNNELPLVLAPNLLKKILKVSSKFVFKEDRLFYKCSKDHRLFEVPYIPYVERQELIKKYHVTLGHMATATLLPLMRVRYYWPNMEKDILNFSNNCSMCQLNSTEKVESRPLQPHDPVGMPFLKFGIDFLQDLPETDEGYKNIFTAKCYATKMVILVPTRSRTAQVAARCIYENIV